MESLGTGVQLYALIFARVMGLFFTAPVVNAASVSTTGRVALGLMVSALLYSPTVNYLPELPPNTGSFVLTVMGQALIGILIGYMITAIFASFQIAGEIFSVQVGLSFSEVLDPQSQVSAPILGTLKNTMGLLLFLTVDFQMDGVYVPAYLHMFRALAYSFHTVPALLPTGNIPGGILAFLDGVMGAMFVTALKIGIPIIGILFITSVALGILGRAAPQMNLMNMGLQINIIVGLISLAFLSPVIVPLMIDAFRLSFDRVGDMLHNWPAATGAVVR